MVRGGRSYCEFRRVGGIPPSDGTWAAIDYEELKVWDELGIAACIRAPKILWMCLSANDIQCAYGPKLYLTRRLILDKHSIELSNEIPSPKGYFPVEMNRMGGIDRNFKAATI
jgi:hypothetical protein